MTDTTKIVLSGGHELTVVEPPADVLQKLSSEGARLVQSRKADSGNVDIDVYVAVDQVAYIEQVPPDRRPPVRHTPHQPRRGKTS
jgi:hypothetical protein